MDIRTITESFSVSPQIAPDEVAELAAQGFTMVVNNRPDGESGDQPAGAAIAAAAAEHGMGYVAIPVDHSGMSMDQVEALGAALAGDGAGKVLAFCRSGTRSSMLWALARARTGGDPATISAEVAAAGYDTSPIRPAMEALAGA